MPFLKAPVVLEFFFSKTLLMFSDVLRCSRSGVLARLAKMQRGPLPETEMMEAFASGGWWRLFAGWCEAIEVVCFGMKFLF